MTRVCENKMIEDIRVGDGAAITRTLHPADLRAWAAVSGNPCLDDSFIETQGPTQWAAMLFSAVIGSSLPGPGSVIQSVSARFQRPIPRTAKSRSS
jgi:phosphate acetyltransferase